MSTTPISTTWTKLSDPGNDGLLISSFGSTLVEIGVTTTDAAPTTGHAIEGRFLLSRQQLGNGYIWARIPEESNVDRLELKVTKGGGVSSSIGTTVAVSASARSCVGRETLSVATGAVSTLTVPVGAVAAWIQADGSAVSMTLDGSTVPTATVGTRIDDGVIVQIDSSLAAVKLKARTATTNVQVTYFDKP